MQIAIRHLRGAQTDEVGTESKEIGPVVEEQQVPDGTDGTDGPSICTDPAVPPATDLING